MSATVDFFCQIVYRHYGGVMYIVIEGGDFTGKTTLATAVVELLKAHFPGRTVHHRREPGGTSFGESVRALLMSCAELDETNTLLLMMTSRRALLTEIANSDDIYVVERSVVSSIVYQHFLGGISMETINTLHTLTQPDIRPDIIFIFDIRRETLLERASHRKLDRLDEHAITHIDQVVDAYKSVINDPVPYIGARLITLNETHTPQYVEWFIATAIEGYNYEPSEKNT